MPIRSSSRNGGGASDIAPMAQRYSHCVRVILLLRNSDIAALPQLWNIWNYLNAHLFKVYLCTHFAYSKTEFRAATAASI